MTYLLTTVFILAWSVPVMAFDFDWPVERINLLEFEEAKEEGREPNAHFHSCVGLQWSETQQKAFRQLRAYLKEELNPLKVQLRNAHKLYKATLLDAESAETIAHKGATNAGRIKKEIRKTRKAYLHTLFYEVMRPEQRPALNRCINHFHHHLQVREIRSKEKRHQKFHETNRVKTNTLMH